MHSSPKHLELVSKQVKRMLATYPNCAMLVAHSMTASQAMQAAFLLSQGQVCLAFAL